MSEIIPTVTTGGRCLSRVDNGVSSWSCQLTAGHDGPHAATSRGTFAADAMFARKGETTLTVTWEAPIEVDEDLKRSILGGADQRATRDAALTQLIRDAEDAGLYEATVGTPPRTR